MEATKGSSQNQVKLVQEQTRVAFSRLRSGELSSLSKLVNSRLDRLFDTLKKSDDLPTIRFVQGQISVYEWLINNINS